jgi:hypothetical protein
MFELFTNPWVTRGFTQPVPDLRVHFPRPKTHQETGTGRVQPSTRGFGRGLGIIALSRISAEIRG